MDGGKKKVSSSTKVTERIAKFVLTGGPCAGKTTLVEKFQNEVKNIPYVKLFFAREAATFLKQSGINFIDAGGDETFQKLIIKQQILAEESAYTAALNFAKTHPNHKVIILCDRGIMDGEAYFKDPQEFENLLAEFYLTKEKVYERYDMVLFLRSAAVGAKQAYTTLDGTPRDEPLEVAVERDAGVYKAWQDHKDFRIIENTFNFYEKLEEGVKQIFQAAGMQVPTKHYRRYIIDMPDLVDVLKMNDFVNSQEQFFFLKNEIKDTLSYLKIQRTATETRYTLSEIRFGHVIMDNNVSVFTRVVDKESAITLEDFSKYLNDLDPTINHLTRHNSGFIINYAIRCELELYEHCTRQYAILKTFMDTPDYEEVVRKRFHIVKDISDDEGYTKVEIAKHGKKLFDLKP